MELDHPSGKMVVILRLFSEKKSFLVHLRSAKDPKPSYRYILSRASYYKDHVILDHFNFPL